MPTATLKFPRSFSTKGLNFEKGKPVAVSDEVGVALAEDPRFEVTGLPGDAVADKSYFAAARAGGRPVVRATRNAMIGEATSQLDEDNEDHFQANGLPNLDALSTILGWAVTESDVRAALRPGADRILPDGTPLVGAERIAPNADDIKAAVAEHAKGTTTMRPRETPQTIAVSDTSARIVADVGEGIDKDLLEPPGQGTSDKPIVSKPNKVTIVRGVVSKPRTEAEAIDPTTIGAVSVISRKATTT